MHFWRSSGQPSLQLYCAFLPNVNVKTKDTLTCKQSPSLELGGASTANFGMKRGAGRLSECKFWILLMARVMLMNTSRRWFWFMVQYMIYLTFHLFLERVVALMNYFEPQVCKKSKSKLIDSSLNIFDRVMSQFLISCKILLLIKWWQTFNPKHSIGLHRGRFLGNKGHRVIFYNTLLIIHFVPVSPAVKK